MPRWWGGAFAAPSEVVKVLNCLWNSQTEMLMRGYKSYTAENIYHHAEQNHQHFERLDYQEAAIAGATRNDRAWTILHHQLETEVALSEEHGVCLVVAFYAHVLCQLLTVSLQAVGTQGLYIILQQPADVASSDFIGPTD